MRKLLCFCLWFNVAMVVLSIGLAIAALLSKELRESVSFLTAISILAITSTHFVGTVMVIVSIKELKELKTKT